MLDSEDVEHVCAVEHLDALLVGGAASAQPAQGSDRIALHNLPGPHTVQDPVSQPPTAVKVWRHPVLRSVWGCVGVCTNAAISRADEAGPHPSLGRPPAQHPSSPGAVAARMAVAYVKV